MEPWRVMSLIQYKKDNFFYSFYIEFYSLMIQSELKKSIYIKKEKTLKQFQ